MLAMRTASAVLLQHLYRPALAMRTAFAVLLRRRPALRSTRRPCYTSCTPLCRCALPSFHVCWPSVLRMQEVCRHWAIQHMQQQVDKPQLSPPCSNILGDACRLITEWSRRGCCCSAGPAVLRLTGARPCDAHGMPLQRCAAHSLCCSLHTRMLVFGVTCAQHTGCQCEKKLAWQLMYSMTDCIEPRLILVQYSAGTCIEAAQRAPRPSILPR